MYKKIISLFLSCALLCAVCIPAFAAETDNDYVAEWIAGGFNVTDNLDTCPHCGYHGTMQQTYKNYQYTVASLKVVDLNVYYCTNCNEYSVKLPFLNVLAYHPLVSGEMHSVFRQYTGGAGRQDVLEKWVAPVDAAGQYTVYATLENASAFAIGGLTTNITDAMRNRTWRSINSARYFSNTSNMHYDDSLTWLDLDSYFVTEGSSRGTVGWNWAGYNTLVYLVPFTGTFVDTGLYNTFYDITGIKAAQHWPYSYAVYTGDWSTQVKSSAKSGVYVDDADTVPVAYHFVGGSSVVFSSAEFGDTLTAGQHIAINPWQTALRGLDTVNFTLSADRYLTLNYADLVAGADGGYQVGDYNYNYNTQTITNVTNNYTYYTTMDNYEYVTNEGDTVYGDTINNINFTGFPDSDPPTETDTPIWGDILGALGGMLGGLLMQLGRIVLWFIGWCSRLAVLLVDWIYMPAPLVLLVGFSVPLVVVLCIIRFLRG